MSDGKIIGYIRVSSYEQNPERQLEGIKIDKCFTDKASGKDIHCQPPRKLTHPPANFIDPPR